MMDARIAVAVSHICGNAITFNIYFIWKQDLALQSALERMTWYAGTKRDVIATGSVLTYGME